MGVFTRRRDRRPAEPLTDTVVRCLPPLGSERPIAHNQLDIRGYAVGPSPVTGVLYEAGDLRGPLVTGLASPEAAAEFPGSRAAMNAGFAGWLNTSAWQPGVYAVSILATSEAGEPGAWRGEVEVLPFDSAMLPTTELAAGARAGLTGMRLESPVSGQRIPRGKYFEVRGWAHCRAGIREVVVTVDDSLRFSANHGLHRPDVELEIPGVDLTRSGFAVRLDPRVLELGEHVITVVAIGEGPGQPMGVRWPFVVTGTVAEADDRPPEAAPLPSLAEAKFTINPPAADEESSAQALATERYVPGTRLHDRRLIEAEHLARYRWASAAAADRRVLDAACGVGYGTAILASAGASRTVGVDIEARAILEARQAHDGIEFEVADLHELPFDDASFDLAVCFEAIEHTTDPDRALDELKRVLGPNGLLLISSPNRGVYPGNPWHVHEYVPDELLATLRRRFAQVRLHRQRSHLATMLCDDETFSAADPDAEIEARVGKISGNAAGEELYTLAVASDAELPELDSVLLLTAQEFDVEDWMDLAGDWQARAAWAESEAAASRAEVSFLQLDKERLSEELDTAREAQRVLDDVLSSWSWRVTRPVRAIKRRLGR